MILTPCKWAITASWLFLIWAVRYQVGKKPTEFVGARALYRRPKILLMDEATSHLDVGFRASMLTKLFKS